MLLWTSCLALGKWIEGGAELLVAAAARPARASWETCGSPARVYIIRRFDAANGNFSHLF